jgi:sulfite dehydrogenase (quinone) subunit SoeC
MNPAYSVILFTTASGAGYGLMALLGFVAINHGPASSPAFALTSVAIALALITIGLLSSLFHLGHPERAWRALSQWRSSWLSREGIAATAAYPVFINFALLWSGLVDRPQWLMLSAVFTIAFCAFTVFCTAMIYRSLRTIRRWNHKLVVPVYVLMALATGAVLLASVALPFGRFQVFQAMLAAGAILATGLVKKLYWHMIDNVPRTHTTGEATGLGKNVRMWELPHTNTNFIQKEMGFVVGRKHRDKLRLSVLVTLALAALCALASVVLSPWVMLLALPLIVVAAFVERWLFFAEAEHVSSLYYGRDAV